MIQIKSKKKHSRYKKTVGINITLYFRPSLQKKPEIFKYLYHTLYEAHSCTQPKLYIEALMSKSHCESSFCLMLTIIPIELSLLKIITINYMNGLN